MSNKKDKVEWKYLCIRISYEMVKNIEENMKNRVGISRTGWILESIQEKLRKKKKENL